MSHILFTPIRLHKWDKRCPTKINQAFGFVQWNLEISYLDLLSSMNESMENVSTTGSSEWIFF